jgi:hypothetical protein
MALRPEPSVQYKRLIKRTLVSSLRTVFSSEYPDPQLKDLYVSTTYPLKREHFPALIVGYNESSIKNAGVAHFELLQTDDGAMPIPAKHFMFEGSISLRCVALSPLDLDVMSDSVVELLAFGRLDGLLNRFFEVVYNELSDSAQITFHSDHIDAMSESVMQTEWGSEDNLVYQSGYTVRCSGGFYNRTSLDDLGHYIEDIIVYGNTRFEQEQEKLMDLFGRNHPNPFYIRGRGMIYSTESYTH